MNKPSFDEEKTFWLKGYKYVIGIDEVGRGAFAGPIVAAAVVFNNDTHCQLRQGVSLSEINDSKLLKPKIREKLSKFIKSSCFCYSISQVSVSTINSIGICKANKIAFRKAVGDVIKKIKQKGILTNQSFFVLCDGFHVKYLKEIGLKNQKAIIKGDRKSISIASASIIAKVYRDKYMKHLNKLYPNYGFSNNKGYGTKKHQSMIKTFGLSKVHRTSFNLDLFML